MGWQVEDGTVTANGRVGTDMGRILIRAPEAVHSVQPGQFFMIRCWAGEPLLPRAMAPLRYLPESGEMEIFYRIVGSGTEAIAGAVAGAGARVTGPLGRPSAGNFVGQRVALVGRGVGITPLLPLAKQIVATGGRVLTYLSARTRTYLFGLEEFLELGPVVTAIDDEGEGEKLVSEVLEEELGSRASVDAAYTCGANRLARHLSELGERHGFPTHVFVEEKMGCGVGYCKGCPITSRDTTGYRLICVEGPVFDTQDIVLA